MLDESCRALRRPAFLEEIEKLLGSGSVRVEELKPGLWHTIAKR